MRSLVTSVVLYACESWTLTAELQRRIQAMKNRCYRGKQHHGMDRPGVHQVPEGSGEQGKMEETGCEIICGASTTLAVKG